MDIRSILKRVIEWGVFAVILITPFIVSSDLFFPYITGKNFFFRICVEILLALWAALALIDRRYRPSRSFLVYAVAVLLGTLVLSTIFGANPYRSFWSNYERMEGLIGHLHVFAYFLILISVFKTAVDWRRLFYVFALSGAGMAAYGYMQELGLATISVQSGVRADGTFGNASYMAIFMAMSAFVAAFLFFRSKERWQKILFAVLFFFDIPVVFLTATRGTILGVIGGIGLGALIFVALTRDRKIRIAAGSIVGGLILLAAIFWVFRGTEFVQKNYILSRFREISFHERTVESRFTIWGMAFQGFKERPLVGWGLENFNQVFNKYYRPELWLQEPWFDRAHNVLFDWLIAGGALGFLAYLSVWGCALYILWRPRGVWRVSPPAFTESIVLTSLFAAYFIHNFFVFDNLISYYFFFTILAYIHYRYVEEQPAVGAGVRAATVSRKTLLSASPVLVGIVSVAGLLAVSLYFFNIKPYLAARGLLDTLRGISVYGRDTERVLAQFETVFSYHTFGTGEAREQLSSYANTVVSSDLPQADKIKVLTAAVQGMQKQVADAPEDARAYIMLASLYSTGGQYANALEAVKRALELSPKKQQFYFVLADIYLMMGQIDTAQSKLQFAYDLDKTHHGALLNLAAIAILNHQTAYAEKTLAEFYGTPIVPEKKLVNAYVRVQDYRRAAAIWEKIVENEPDDPQNRVSWAATYVQMGDRARAIQILNDAIASNPSFKPQLEPVIRGIQAGQKPN